MSKPKNDVVQIEYQNPDAKDKLLMPVLITCNTTDELIENNVRINSAKNLKWLHTEKENPYPAIIVGGGASIEDEVENIRHLKSIGGTIFAANAASKWLISKGIEVDFQCIADAKEETVTLVDHNANEHIIASQAHPRTMDSVEDPIVWHLGIEDIERLFPEERVKRGGYCILGGGSAVGNSSMCVAYAKGFRDLHIFGLDSCHKDGRSHAYQQNMNVVIPIMEVEWAGRTFTSSVTMKAQAEKFQLTSKFLKDAGCKITTYGDGLLQTMYNSEYSSLSEKEKYQLMWQLDIYREVSPGEHMAEWYVETFKPKGKIIDFGCGTGRAGVKFKELGLEPFLIDFTDNCRDDEAQEIPFLQWDLTYPISVDSEHGFCTDVMEHIPTEDVEKVIKNIMTSAKKVFFQISTIDDNLGGMINEPLHLTVKTHDWWKEAFKSYLIMYELDQNTASLFYIVNPDRRKQ